RVIQILRTISGFRDEGSFHMKIRTAPLELCWLSACLLAFAAADLRADVIELKTGQKLEGDVLKEGPIELVVDLGIDVVRVPVSQIKSRQTGTASASAGASDAIATDRHGIYETAELPVRTIKELTQRFGEGVVLVQTPSGLGSGFIIDDRGYCVTNHHVVE